MQLEHRCKHSLSFRSTARRAAANLNRFKKYLIRKGRSRLRADILYIPDNLKHSRAARSFFASLSNVLVSLIVLADRENRMKKIQRPITRTLHRSTQKRRLFLRSDLRNDKLVALAPARTRNPGIVAQEAHQGWDIKLMRLSGESRSLTRA